MSKHEQACACMLCMDQSACYAYNDVSKHVHACCAWTTDACKYRMSIHACPASPTCTPWHFIPFSRAFPLPSPLFSLLPAKCKIKKPAPLPALCSHLETLCERVLSDTGCVQRALDIHLHQDIYSTIDVCIKTSTQHTSAS